MADEGMRELDDQAYERLSAYFDDELSPSDRRKVEAEIAADPALAQALDEMRALSAELQAAYPLLDAAPARKRVPTTQDPVGSEKLEFPRSEAPQQINPFGRSSDPVGSESALAPPPEPRSRRRHRAPTRAARPQSRLSWGRLPAAAFAAAAALAVGFGVGAWRSPDAPFEGGISAGDVASNSALSTVLETARTGVATSMGAAEVVILGTFLKGDGGPCREFEKLTQEDATLTFGVACRATGDAWRVVFAASAPKEENADGRITPASGPGVDAMGQLLDSLGAGPMLSADEEAQLIGRGWR